MRFVAMTLFLLFAPAAMAQNSPEVQTITPTALPDSVKKDNEDRLKQAVDAINAKAEAKRAALIKRSEKTGQKQAAPKDAPGLVDRIKNLF